ncbi:lysoplasmalogenase [Bacillus methanolicus]|uniref:lysoplasmalogenase family protein n=1 Tax=Bacillus methanolicus TaxID=1471 RepID=UPI00200D8D83|nr:lysoplasmalogenase family protein [Bacillus methanolicus]UQD50778.1 lysoplasmalogenase [Bacillus methanolicus]
MNKKGLPFLIMLAGSFYLVYVPEGFEQLLLKLLPMCLIITYAFLNSTMGPIRKWIIAGLLFSMLGDALILCSFVAGLAAFLIGHILYMTRFLLIRKGWKRKALFLIPIALYALLIVEELVQYILNSGNHSLVIPVIGYIISLMAWTAMMTGNNWAILGS